MPKSKKTASGQQEHIVYHRDGSVWAKGQMANGKPTGYWEWFRKDGVKMRSGYFEAGQQVGEWTTYDKNGGVYKVTQIKPKKSPQIKKAKPKKAVKRKAKQVVKSKPAKKK